ncbi:histidinol dehydrogenase [Clostridium carboxidivorans P7]|uniref:Histidinol dehydrogenase n=1 Tax=Clostridium carboxidivorans P7 TaxID=536227 RepID=C6PUR0_9CLOT|nr:histidinol dehydrogenase [Clostridium carboxidivorans]AKN29351.1 histidinol dehydrogenase [Clostridium carboxidivorans P7]EET86989.1 Histidinol dehydrogenase [Clostridium carboxidivorans P7]EFG89738.1 histidinol dehydrogenase [Clostridium carboxidivorans P7]
MSIINTIYGNTKAGKDFLKSLRNREESVHQEVTKQVEIILRDVKEKGDEALISYTNQFDSKNVDIKNICVTKEEIDKAYENVDKEFIDAINLAVKNIKFFHEKQKRNSWMITNEKEVVLGQQIRPLQKVGIYVPGGTAAYPSSVLMNTIPAKVAGVRSITMVTPPSKDGSINPNILVAADIAGVDKIYKAGGAQAVAALAFGTETIERVDKIVGPGNIYVAMAKKSVYGNVDIDMIAGPSEILVIADENANPKYIAADLMSQAEHDKLASAILITTSEDLAEKVKAQLKLQVENLSRKDIILHSLKNYGAIIIVDSIEKAIEMSNDIAPEHLELCIKDPFLSLGDVKNAGSIFLGYFAPEPLGDYIAGPNHVLPTSGTARFFSPLSVDDFVKKSSFIRYSKEALLDVGDKVIKLAETEGLTAHANSIKVRMED